MFLSRFGVKNYKCLVDIDIPLTPIHVLIGQNDTGKTSLLEAMEAFYGSGDYPLARAFSYFDGQQRKLVFSRSEGETLELSGEWLDSSDKNATTTSHGFVARFPSSDQMVCFLDEEHYRIDDKEIHRPNKSHNKKTQDIPQQTLVCDFRQNRSVPSEFEPFVETVANLLGFAQKYSFQPKMLATPATIDRTRAFRMDPDGFGLATLLDDIVNFEPERIIKLREAFCSHFPQYTNIRVQACDAVARNYGGSDVLTKTGDGKGVFFALQDGTLAT